MKITQWASIFVFIGVMLTIVDPVSAQTPNVNLQVTPASVKLSANESATLFLTAMNSSAVPLQDVRLTFIGDSLVKVDLMSVPIATMIPQVGYVWQIQVVPITPLADIRILTVRLDYSTVTTNGTPTPGTAFASIQVQPRAPDTVDKVAVMRLETAFDQVEENRPGVAYLILSNISDVPLTINQINIEHSESVQVTPSIAVSLGSTILPQSSVTWPYTITTQSRVIPGKSRILLHADISWQRADQMSTGVLDASTSFNVGVFGESALTTVFGVPSFLLLPGLLILVMMGWMRGLVKRPLDLEPKSPRFWVFAVLISMGVAYFYPSITANWLNNPRNYLAAYGLIDVVWVVIGSLLAGIGFGFLWNFWDIFLDWVRHQIFVPSPKDNPIQLLNRLTWWRRGLLMPYVIVRQGTRTQNCIELVRDPLKKTVWVTPLARYMWLIQPENHLLLDFDRELERANNPKKLASIIAQANSDGVKKIEVAWEKARLIEAVTEVAEESIVPIEGPKIRLLAEK